LACKHRPAGLPAPAAPACAALAVRVWNFLGGLDWAGLPTAMQIFGVQDPDTLIHALVAIRDHNK
jgi:hypothetical protein